MVTAEEDSDSHVDMKSLPWDFAKSNLNKNFECMFLFVRGVCGIYMYIYMNV